MAMWRWKLSRGSAGSDVVFRDFVAGWEVTLGGWELSWKRPTPTEAYVHIGPLVLFAIRLSELLKDTDR